MADQTVNNVNETAEQPQQQETPEAVDPSDMDPQSAVADKGWEIIKNHPEVQKFISGQNLEDYHNTIKAAIAGDRDAQMAVADHSLGTAMGTIQGKGPSAGPLPLQAVTVPEGQIGGIIKSSQPLYAFSLETPNLEKAKQVLNAVQRQTPNNKDLIRALQNQVGFLQNRAEKYAADLAAKKQSAINFAKGKSSGGEIDRYHHGGHIQHFADGGEVQAEPQQPSSPGISLVNAQTNQAEVVPHDQAAQAFASGAYNLHANQPIILTDPKGNLVQVDPSEVYQSITEGGYNFANPNQVHDADMQARYGEGALNAAKAFGAAAARTATLGLSDVGLTQTGLVNPETLQELKERNPVSSFAGDVAGIAGSLALGPETAVGKLAQLGKGAEGLAAGIIPAGESVAGRILSNAATKGLGSAVEGLGYGAGNLVTEAALGDPNLNAQSAAAHLGFSALLGGGLGSLIGAGEIAVPEAVNAASSALKKIKEGPLGDMAGSAYDKASSFVSGKSEADINALRLRRHDILNNPESTEKAATGIAKDYQDLYENVGKISKETNKDIRPAEINELVSSTDPLKAMNLREDVENQLRDTINELRAEPQLYSQGTARKLELFEESFLGRPGEITDIGEEGLFNRKLHPGEGALKDPAEIFHSINDLKKLVGEESKFGKKVLDAETQRSLDLVKRLYGKLRGSLENTEVWGEAAVRQAEFNDATSELLNAKELFEKNFGQKVKTKSGNVEYHIDPVKINTYLKQIDTLRGDAKADILRNFQEKSEKYIDQVQKSYENAPAREFNRESVDNMAKKVAEAHNDYQQKAEFQNLIKRVGAQEPGMASMGAGAIAGHMIGIPTPVTAGYIALKSPLQTIQRLAQFERLVQKTTNAVTKGASGLFKAGEKVTGYAGSQIAYSRENHENISNEIKQLTSDPEKLIDKLHETTAKLQDHAPQTSTALQTTTINALNFLQSKLPQPAPETPLGNKIPATKAEINKFSRYYEMVSNPTSVFQQMQAGTLTKEAVETLNTVYPDLYAKMKQEVIENMANAKTKGQTIPTSLKTQLSLFMNQDMNLGINAKAIVANQLAQGQAMAQQNQLDQGFINPVKPTSNGLGKIEASSRSLTPMQMSSQRK